MDKTLRIIVRTPQLLVFFFMFSCTQVTELQIPDPEPELIVNGLFTPDSTWKINVSTNTSIYNSDYEPTYLDHAKVSLWEDDSLLGTLIPSGRGNYRLNRYPKAGTTYRLLVEADGFSPVSAEDRIPIHVPEIDNIIWDLDREVVLGDQTGGVYTTNPLTFDVIHHPDEPEYYRVQQILLDSCDCLDHPIWPLVDFLDDPPIFLGLDTRFPLCEPSARDHNILMFRDDGIEGLSTTIECYSSDTLNAFYSYSLPRSDNDTLWLYDYNGIGPDQTPRKTYVRMYLDTWNMSESLYRYQLSYLTQGYNSGDPFAVHINVFSNTSNRRGIFAGYQRKWFLFYQRG